jgi:hypothetical protein
MKNLISIIFLFVSTSIFSQSYGQKNEFITKNGDTIGVIKSIKSDLSKNIQVNTRNGITGNFTDTTKYILTNLDMLSFLNKVDADIVINKPISNDDKKNINEIIFNQNCNCNFIFNSDTSKLSASGNYSEFNLPVNIDGIGDGVSLNYSLQMNELQERLSLSSYYTIKSANQRNYSLVIGILGSIVSTAVITNNIKNGQTPVFGYVLLGGTAVATLSLQISSNNNQKQAGLALKLK